MLDNGPHKLGVFRRSKTFTPAGISLINRLREEGRSPAEIAEALGCALGTLRVRCSQLGISLRQGQERRGLKTTDNALTVTLSSQTIDELRRRAVLVGLTESQLASKLLVAIAQDNLYDAILE
jgi:hypothetical protein